MSLKIVLPHTDISVWGRTILRYWNAERLLLSFLQIFLFPIFVICYVVPLFWDEVFAVHVINVEELELSVNIIVMD